MVTQIDLGGIAVDVVRKDIKNVHLSVYPPTGRVRIAAPSRMGLDTIRVFAISKLAWIRSQQLKISAQDRETPREYLDRESHYVWGRRYLLKIIERDTPPIVELEHSRICLQVRPRSDAAIRHAALEGWYRALLKQQALKLIRKWEAVIGVKVDRFFVQKMKTRWGGCNPKARSIRLNTDLAKKPLECLEYIIVHEMVHLLEPTHSSRFRALMDRHMPKWQFHRVELNQLPLRHEDWKY